MALVASDATLLYALKKAGAEEGQPLRAPLWATPRPTAEARAAADWLKLPLVAAPVASFAEPSGYAVHRVLRAAKHLPPEAAPTDYFLPATRRASGSRGIRAPSISRGSWRPRAT